LETANERLEKETLEIHLPAHFNFHLETLQRYTPNMESVVENMFGRTLKLSPTFAPRPKNVDIHQDPGIKSIVEKFQGARIQNIEE
jgi:hypothetical protein